ncbi:MAG: ROK family protein [Bdellovibrionales bacterium]|nr:ROK family protein [Bdellovibrionales bacterium]
MGGKVIGVDLGGTKLAMGVVTSQGQILDSIREPVQLSQGPQGLISQIAELAEALSKKFGPVEGLGIASAGPLDPRAGVLLDPTNLHEAGQAWGVVPLAEPLKKRLKIAVSIENDAAAAALAEQWLGSNRHCQNSVMMTLGTGLGVGVIANGQLVRSGRHLHPEVGHVFLHYGDSTAPCGCGNFGCAEAYLSGRNFSERCAREWGEKNLTGEELVSRARAGEARALKAFAAYADYFAAMVTILVVQFSPERIVIAGGFSEAKDLFLTQALEKLKTLLSRRRQGVDLFPQIEVSSLGAQAGVLGGAYVALHSSLSP